MDKIKTIINNNDYRDKHFYVTHEENGYTIYRPCEPKGRSYYLISTIFWDRYGLSVSGLLDEDTGTKDFDYDYSKLLKNKDRPIMCHDLVATYLENNELKRMDYFNGTLMYFDILKKLGVRL